MEFEILGKLGDVEIIAAGQGVRDLKRLRRAYGGERWRKLKGVATVRLPDGAVSRAELHWYEAHGVGKREMKIKCLLDE